MVSGLLGRLDALTPPAGGLILAFLGQVGFALRGPDGVLYIDPYLSDYGWPLPDGRIQRLPRAYPPPLAPDQARDASAVLITHDHADHFDPETLAGLLQAAPGAVVYGPYRCRDTHPGVPLQVVHALRPFQIGAARVTPLPAAHTTLDHGARGYPYLGYLIEWNGLTVYHAGDTLVYGDAPGLPGGLPSLLSGWDIDVAVLPINGGDYFRRHREEHSVDPNMTFREAVDLSRALGVRLLIPTHFDLFDFNSENPAFLVDYARRAAPELGLKVMVPGELHCQVNWTAHARRPAPAGPGGA